MSYLTNSCYVIIKFLILNYFQFLQRDKECNGAMLSETRYLKSVAVWFGLLRSHLSLRWGLLGIGNLSSAFPEHQQWKPEGSWRFQAFYIIASEMD